MKALKVLLKFSWFRLRVLFMPFGSPVGNEFSIIVSGETKVIARVNWLGEIEPVVKF